MKTEVFNRAARQAKSARRVGLTKLSYEEKVAIVVRLQRAAREMARAAGRPFKGCVWG